MRPSFQSGPPGVPCYDTLLASSEYSPSVAATNDPSPALAVGNAKDQHQERQLCTKLACR